MTSEKRITDIRIYHRSQLVCDMLEGRRGYIVQNLKGLRGQQRDNSNSESEWLVDLFELSDDDLNQWTVADDGSFVEWERAQIRLTAQELWQASVSWHQYRWKKNQLKTSIAEEDLYGFWTYALRYVDLQPNGKCLEWNKGFHGYGTDLIQADFKWTFDGNSRFTITHSLHEPLAESVGSDFLVFRNKVEKFDGRCMELTCRFESSLLQYDDIHWWARGKPPKWYKRYSTA